MLIVRCYTTENVLPFLDTQLKTLIKEVEDGK